MIDALWGWPPPVLDPAGPYAHSVTVLAWALIALAAFVTAIVLVALYIAIKGPPRLKEKLGGETTVWIGGVAFPGLVLTGLLIWGLTLTASLTEPITGEEMRIRVTGEMWWFRVQYLDENGAVVIEDANELHLPAGRPVVLELRSADVIHSFWVPRLSGKQDMIPGRTTLLRVEADTDGYYGGVCAEYCGGPHALMGFVTIAHAPEEWSEWFAARRARQLIGPAIRPSAGETIPAIAASAPMAGREAGPTAIAASGRELFMDSGCAACHRVAGTEANGLAGPDLTHVGSRATLGAGILPNNLGTMMGWIGDSQSIKPGNRMPSFDMLSAEEIEAIAVWLEQQK